MTYKYRDYHLRSLELGDFRFIDTLAAEIEYLASLVSRKPGIENVLEVGTGNGRVLFNLARWLRNKSHPDCFVGIDFDKVLLKEAEDRKRNDVNEKPYFRKLEFQLMDARRMEFSDKYFEFVFSAYNTLGGMSPQSREKIVREIARVTFDGGGEVHNLVWRNDSYTTGFLSDFYPAIGLDVVEIKPDRSVLEDKAGKRHVVYRPTPESLVKLYREEGIETMQVTPVGGLLNDVSGVKWE